MISLITDSSANISEAQAEALGVRMVPIDYSINCQSYSESFSNCNGDFERLIHKYPFNSNTSHPSVGAFLSIFKECLRRGEQVICITLSSRLSGTYRSATIAAHEADSDNIIVIDSLSVAGGILLMLEKAKELIDNGNITLFELAVSLEQLRNKIGLIFSLDSMEPLRRSGRLGMVRHSVGTILNIKPLLTCKNGTIFSEGQAKGKINQARMMAERIPEKTKRIICHFFGERSNLDNIKFEIDKRFPNIPKSLNRLGPVLGIHLGLSALGIAWVEE